MASVLSSELPPVQVLLDLQQQRIRWRVLLVPRPGAAPLVLIEKIGKGGRVLHQRRVLWSRTLSGPASTNSWVPPKGSAQALPLCGAAQGSGRAR